MTSPGSFAERYFFPLSGLLLVIMAATQIGSALQESPTNDEPVHLMSGYVYLTTGDYILDLTHPPLGRVLAALPLLWSNLKHVAPEHAGTDIPILIWGNNISAESIMLRARGAIITLTFLFGVWLAWWTRRRFGAAAALLALTFFAFDPNLIAHGHYATTDLIASFGIFLTCTLWADFLDAPGWGRLSAAALALGVALVSKYSAMFLLFVLPVLYVVAWYRNRRSPDLPLTDRARQFFRLRGAIQTFAIMTAATALVIALTYAPEIGGAPDQSLKWISSPGEVAPVPHVDSRWRSFGYVEGLCEIVQHAAGGHPSYLLGNFRSTGWWYYFPVAFLVKTPTGTILACLIALVCLLQLRRRSPPALLLWCLALPPAIYLVIAMSGKIDLGIRHILPVYPFLYVLLAYLLIDCGPIMLRREWKRTVTALIVLTCAESLATYPHYLAFFNWPSGGPDNGSRYLLDSNIDWGQDRMNLGVFLRDRQMTPLCTALYGAAPSAYYGIIGRDLNQTGMPEGVENLNCVVAVSVNLLRGMYKAPQKYAPLLRREPIARIGHSIFVYDLRHDSSASRR